MTALRQTCCGHPRLLHDSWGCKAKCGCGVSIIYLTPDPLIEGTPESDKEVIEQGNLFDKASDRLEEFHLREMYDRALAERSSETTE